MDQKEKESILFKFCKFVGKDTSEKNESKKLIVVLRVIILSMMVYFVINGFIYVDTLSTKGIIIFLTSFIVFILLFGISYYLKTLSILVLFNISMIIWMIESIKYFGWDIGVQHFLLLLLVLCFFSGYQQYKLKIVIAAIFCGLRIYLYFMCKQILPAVTLNSVMGNLLQIVNTLFIFWCISVICFVFSKDSKELEGKLVAYNEQLKEQANTDTLTRLYNRRKAMEYLTNLTQMNSYQKGFSVCICDIDFFKSVNDNYGHDFGDLVLKNISEIMQKELKEIGFAARWGGEEFLIVFPNYNGDQAFINLEKLRWKIKNLRIKGNNQDIKITMTFGLAEYDFANGLEATIKEADQKLYMGKAAGRDRIVF